MKPEQEIKDQIERFNKMISKENDKDVRIVLIVQRDILRWAIEPPLQQGFSLAPGESKEMSIEFEVKK